MYKVRTTSGAEYLFDDSTLCIQRVGPAADTDEDKPDGEWLPIKEWSRPVVGQSWMMVFLDDRVRMTTPVVSIENN